MFAVFNRRVFLRSIAVINILQQFDEVGESNIVFIIKMLAHFSEILIKKFLQQFQLFLRMIFLQLQDIRFYLRVHFKSVIMMTIFQKIDYLQQVIFSVCMIFFSSETII